MAADGGLQMPDLQYKMSKKISQLQKVRNNIIFRMPNDAARAALLLGKSEKGSCGSLKKVCGVSELPHYEIR